MDKQSISRRSFLGGAAAAGTAVVVGALAGCAPSGQTSDPVSTPTSTEEGGNLDRANFWLGSPPEIDEVSITTTHNFDIVVVGGGLSGLVALNVALEGGATACIIEKNKRTRYGGAALACINSKAQLEAGFPEVDPTDFIREEALKTNNMTDSIVFSAWAWNIGEAVDWLLEKTAAVGSIHSLNPEHALGNADLSLEPFHSVPYASVGMCEESWELYGHECLKPAIDALVASGEASGGEFFYNTSGIKLEQGADNTVTGVIAKTRDGEYLRFTANKGVIVSTGDFAGDKNMVDAYLPTYVGQYLYDSSCYTMYMVGEDIEDASERLDTGDGHKMIVWAGGVMENNPCATLGWPVSSAPATDFMFAMTPFLGVDTLGCRFMNESNASFTMAFNSFNRPSSQTRGNNTWKIIDSNYIDQLLEMNEKIGAERFNPMMLGDPAILQEPPQGMADTIEDLAVEIGADPAILKATVDRYNELVNLGVDKDYGKAPHFLAPVVQPPFYAVRIQHMLCATLGGVICTGNLEVMNKDGVIPGLYATGNVVGRRFGQNYELSLAGISNGYAIAHGWVAAKHCLQR